jgi:hypothetical protein
VTRPALSIGFRRAGGPAFWRGRRGVSPAAPLIRNEDCISFLLGKAYRDRAAESDLFGRFDAGDAARLRGMLAKIGEIEAGA